MHENAGTFVLRNKETFRYEFDGDGHRVSDHELGLPACTTYTHPDG
jgi:hypothetical protein